MAKEVIIAPQAGCEEVIEVLLTPNKFPNTNKEIICENEEA